MTPLEREEKLLALLERRRDLVDRDNELENELDRLTCLLDEVREERKDAVDELDRVRAELYDVEEALEYF